MVVVVFFATTFLSLATTNCLFLLSIVKNMGAGHFVSVFDVGYDKSFTFVSGDETTVYCCRNYSFIP